MAEVNAASSGDSLPPDVTLASTLTVFSESAENLPFSWLFPSRFQFQ